jgi:hypothetical protein
MTRSFVAFCGLAITICSASVCIADPEECRNAVDQYNSTRSEVSDTLKTYASCISDSRGRDDCSTEFSSLQSAQDDFESAVSEYESECQ